MNAGRESILQLKDELAGRVSRQVRAFEQRSMENIQNRSVLLSGSSKENVDPKINQTTGNIFSTLAPFNIVNIPEEKLFQQAFTRNSSNGNHLAGEVTRSVKRLQNTPMRRWKERAKEFERRHQLTPPHRLLTRKRR